MAENGKEPWDKSNERAMDLKIEDFGTPEEIIEMASPIRTAKNRPEAVKILKEIKKSGTLINKNNTNLLVVLSGNSIKKLVSDKALYTSFDKTAHWQATANIDKLFFYAIEPWTFEFDPNKNNTNLADRKYLYAPMELSGKIIPVKFTVKEYKNYLDGTRIYSIEALNVCLL